MGCPNNGDESVGCREGRARDPIPPLCDAAAELTALSIIMRCSLCWCLAPAVGAIPTLTPGRDVSDVSGATPDAGSSGAMGAGFRTTVMRKR